MATLTDDAVYDLHDEALPPARAELPPKRGGDLVAINEPGWTKEGKKIIRTSSGKLEGTGKSKDLDQAKAEFQRKQAEHAQHAQQQKQKAREDFERLQAKHGADFPQMAREEYELTYKPSRDFDIGTPTPYGEEMARLLRKYLDL